MTSKRRGFARPALAVLLIGLAAIVAVVLLVPLTSFGGQAQVVDSIPAAKRAVERYLGANGQSFKIKEIMEFSNNFYAVVQEQGTGMGAFELLVDRYTGSVGPEPGPNMMWNKKYGHMGGVSSSYPAMTVGADQAMALAQKWLDQNYPGSKPEEPNAFYGYYTMDVSQGGKIFGMLSVNGYTGAVWYHTWHGQFVAMEEF